MERTGLETGLPTLKDKKGTEVERKEDKRSEKANTQERRVVAEAGGSSTERVCSEQSWHGSSHRDFSFPNLAQSLAGFSLASLSRLDLTVSLSNQGCRPYALAILGPPFAPCSGQSDTPGASQRLGSWVPPAWQSFSSFPIYQWPVQTTFNLILVVISLPPSHFLCLSSQKIEALLHGHQHNFSPLKMFLYCHLFSFYVPDHPLNFTHHILRLDYN